MAATETPLTRMAIFALLVVLVGLFLHGWAKIYDDAAADRVMVQAAWTGVDPYQPYPELYEHVGLRGGGFEGTPPRTPAVFIFQAFTLLVPVEYAGVLNIVLAAVSLTTICVLSARLAGWDLKWWPLLVLASHPVLLSLRFANIVFVYMALIVWSLSGRDWRRGFALGVVAATRLWPSVIIIALWLEGRRKAAVAAGTTAILLNLAGLALPTVGLTSAIEGMRSGELFFGSLSSAMPGLWFFWPIVAVLLIVLVPSVEVSVPAGATAAPISWPTYYLAALPSILSHRAWGPAFMIGAMSAVHPWFSAAGGIWLIVRVVQDARSGAGFIYGPARTYG